MFCTPPIDEATAQSAYDTQWHTPTPQLPHTQGRMANSAAENHLTEALQRLRRLCREWRHSKRTNEVR